MDGDMAADIFSPGTLNSIPEEQRMNYGNDSPLFPDAQEDAYTPRAAKRQRQEHTCDVCNTSYTERRSLLRHERTPAHCRRAGSASHHHLHQCDYCTKSFTRRDLLQRHVREIHEGRRRKAHVQPPDSSTASSNEPNNSSLQPHDTSGTSENKEVVDAQLPALDYNSSSDTNSSEHTPTDVDFHIPQDLSWGGTHIGPRILDVQDELNTLFVAPPGCPEPLKATTGLSLPLRPRSGTAERGGRNPCPERLLAIQPCPLCKTELGSTEEEVEKHIGGHFHDLSQIPEGRTCSICRVGFMHEKDLSFHLNSVRTSGKCGFEFVHAADCTGHHPPTESGRSVVNHARFTQQLRNWELAQLGYFRDYLDNYTEGRIPVNRPSGRSPSVPWYTRSLGSLRSTISYLSARSAPAGMTSLDATSFRRLSSRLKLLEAKTIRIVRGEVAAISSAINSGNYAYVQPLLPPMGTSAVTDIISTVKPEALPKLLSLLENSVITNVIVATVTRLDFNTMESILGHLPPRYRYELRHMRISHFLNGKEIEELSTEIMPKLLPCIDLLLNNGVLYHHSVENLMAVSRRGDAGDITRILLDHWAGIKHCTRESRTPHIIATYRRAQNVVNAILEHHGVVRVQGSYFTILCTAAENASYTIELLLHKGSAFDAVESSEQTALMCVAMSDRCDALKALLEKGASINGKDRSGRTALMWAAIRGSNGAMRILVDNGAMIHQKDFLGNTAAMVASERLQSDYWGIRELAMIGSENELYQEIRGNVLLLAAEHGHSLVTEFLLSDGVSVEARNWLGQTPLMSAAKGNQRTIVYCLFGYGACIHAVDNNGRTALDYAIFYGSNDVLQDLLNQGATTRVTNSSHMTVLMRAARNNQESIVKTLLLRLDTRQMLNDIDANGWTALTYAVRYGCDKILTLLIDYRAWIDVADRDGWTPLRHACERRSYQVVEKLLQTGADFNLPDLSGMTPLRYAEASNDADLINIFNERRQHISIELNGGEAAVELS